MQFIAVICWFRVFGKQLSSHAKYYYTIRLLQRPSDIEQHLHA